MNFPRITYIWHQTIKSPNEFNRRCLSYLKTKKRFYENVMIKESKGRCYIQLDNRTIKTPLKNDLYAPTNRIASIVATEWNCQNEQLSPDKMHFTALCNTCIDNPRQMTKNETIEEMLSYLHSDTLCARIPAEESEVVAEAQNEKWNPVINWFNARFGVSVISSSDIFGLEQSMETIEKIRNYLLTLNDWQLAGLQFSVESVKSFIIPTAVLEKRLSINEALYLARLEVQLQIEKWGNVEWHHNIEEESQKSHLTSGTLFCKLSSEIAKETS